MTLLLSDFDFDLPQSAIASYPAARRDQSRLMVLERSSGVISHHSFTDLPGFLSQGDLLISNNTKVLKARIATRKISGGKVEVLLVSPTEEADCWRAMVSNSKSLRAGMVLMIDDSRFITVIENEGEGFAIVKLPCSAEELSEACGQIPLPPYLGRPSEPLDDERYQTIFADDLQQRSVAAPTAGLHFTPEIMARLKREGVDHATITLDVGPGTFLPVRSDSIESHEMHNEVFEVDSKAIKKIKSAERVLAVGTTVVRSLESLPALEATRASTRLFITPGFEFRFVDLMLTNFHLPRSTLLMLVSAFAGREFVFEAYRKAVENNYRFFSYGDAMLIL